MIPWPVSMPTIQNVFCGPEPGGESNSTDCKPCSNGTTSEKGARFALPVMLGSTWTAEPARLARAGPASGQSECTECSQGKYANEDINATHAPCPAGNTERQLAAAQRLTETAACVNCAAGFYSSAKVWQSDPCALLVVPDDSLQPLEPLLRLLVNLVR